MNNHNEKRFYARAIIALSNTEHTQRYIILQ